MNNMFFDQGNFYKILIDLKRLALRLQRGLTLNGVKIIYEPGCRRIMNSCMLQIRRALFSLSSTCRLIKYRYVSSATLIKTYTSFKQN